MDDGTTGRTPAVPERGPLPLSTGQEALWLAHQLDPDSSAYNVVLAVRLRDPVRVDALQDALHALAARHELLRSRFPAAADGPVRYAGPPERVRLQVRDLPPGSGAPELLRAATDAGREPFRLAASAFRAVLLRRAPDDGVLVTVTHHLVSDATSQWLLVRDLFALYGARTGARAAALPDTSALPGATALPDTSALPGTPAGWDAQVRAEAEFVGSPRGKRAAGHWRTVCAGLAAAELPADRPRPARRTLNGATHEVALDTATAARLRATAAGRGITPFAWLLGTFQAALHRSGAGPAFLIGCPATTRFTPGTREAVGYYVNALPVAARFTPATTLLETVTAARHQLRAGLAHARLPVELIPGGPAGGPLFRISCTLVAADRLPVEGLYETLRGGGPVRLGGLRAELYDVPQQEGQLDLTVEILQDATGFRAVLRYNTDLFDATAPQRFGTTWLRLLETSLDAPDTPVAAVALVGDDDLRALLALGTGGA
ncbi:condensation domain-containing protein [Streptomyces sp. NPDC093252]|uniref:condensation domain-containing protein n=1 Tax=Streptomyces sp. NPDC093252 TaxID=3154980 RepID=UPI00343A3E8D